MYSNSLLGMGNNVERGWEEVVELELARAVMKGLVRREREKRPDRSNVKLSPSPIFPLPLSDDTVNDFVVVRFEVERWNGSRAAGR